MSRATAALVLSMATPLLLVGCGAPEPQEPGAPEMTGAGGAGSSASDPAATAGPSTGAGTNGTGGAGAADASGGAGGQPVAGLGCGDENDALLCEDFEGGSIDASVWSVLESNGATVTVQADFARDGQYALRIQLPSVDGAEGALRVEPALLFPLPNNSMFGRVHAYITPELPAMHSKLITARGPLADEPAQYRLDSNAGKLNSRYVTPSIDEIEHGGLKKLGYQMPAEEWLCIEWHYDGGNDEMRYWFDGEPADALTVLSTEQPPWVAPAFEQLDIGWRTFQAGGAPDGYDVYYDSIVIDDQRIGCGR
jgi:hypothetical protein